jgi:hypothetical protein
VLGQFLFEYFAGIVGLVESTLWKRSVLHLRQAAHSNQTACVGTYIAHRRQRDRELISAPHARPAPNKPETKKKIPPQKNKKTLLHVTLPEKRILKEPTPQITPEKIHMWQDDCI